MLTLADSMLTRMPAADMRKRICTYHYCASRRPLELLTVHELYPCQQHYVHMGMQLSTHSCIVCKTYCIQNAILV
jgi:hypothetical protein